MPLAATVIDPSTGHCHGPTIHLLGAGGPGGAALVFIGPAMAPPVLIADAYVPTSCGDTAHVPIVTLGSPNVLVGPSLLGMSFLGAPLSCGDIVGANPANNVTVN